MSARAASHPRSPSASSVKLNLVREEVNVDTGDHRLVLSVPTSTGIKDVIVGREFIQNRKALNEFLARKGMLGIGVTQEELNAIAVSQGHRVTSITRRGGWYGKTLVTRNGCFPSSPGSRSHYLFDGSNPHYRAATRAGNLQTFQKRLEPILEKSPELTFAYVLGFVPALAARIERDEGGFCVCFVGEGSTGKTTALRLAQSISARAREKDLVNFGDTEGVVIKGIVENGAQLTCFGDVKKSRDKFAKKLRTMVFNATDGAPRQGEGDRNPLVASYNLYVLSVENSLSELFEKEGEEYQDGELSRLLEIPVADRVNGGIFSGVDQDERQKLVRKVISTIERHHGVALPQWVAFLRRFEKNDEAVVAYILEFRRHLGASFKLEDIEVRVSHHFELIYATGCLAYEVDVSPISQQRLRDVVTEMFQRFLNSRSRQASNSNSSLDLILKILHDEKRFPMVMKGASCDPSCRERGFRRQEEGREILYVSRAYLEGELGGPVSRKLELLFAELVGRKVLKPAKNGYTKSIEQKGIGRPRMLQFDLGPVR